MFGESKFDILQKLPKEFTPAAGLVKFPFNVSDVELIMTELGLTFPVIFKPDIGERGWMVKKINSLSDVESYLKVIKVNFIIQEFVNLPLEFGVYYRRFPSEQKGVVTSVVGKEMLYVEGDGKSTLDELILNKERAKLQRNKLKEVYKDHLNDVLPEGSRKELVSIGNHCLGTMFLDCGHLINEELSNSFDLLSKQISNFYFGRYDLRVASVEDLCKGKVKIMELNGCGAEPSHIYQPGYPLLCAVKELCRHTRELFRVSMENHKAGIKFMPLKEGIYMYKRFKAATK